MFIMAHLAVLQFTEAPHGSIQQKLWSNLRLDDDRSLSETFGHGLSFSAALLLFLTYRATGLRVFLVIAGFTLFVWFDDSNSYHERAGRMISDYLDWNAHWGVPAGDLGQIAAWAIIALVAVPAAIWHLRRLQEQEWIAALICAVPAAVILTCGIIIDFLHSANSGAMATFLTVVEDGGELLGLAMLTILSIGFLRDSRIHRQDQAGLVAEAG